MAHSSMESLRGLATRAAFHLMAGERRRRAGGAREAPREASHRLLLCPSDPGMHSRSLAGLTPELAEVLLAHMSRERLLYPHTLRFFYGCPLQKFVLNCYPYSSDEMLQQLRTFTSLKHLSLVNSPLITGTSITGLVPAWIRTFRPVRSPLTVVLFVPSRLGPVLPVRFVQAPVRQPGLLQQSDRRLPAAHRRSDAPQLILSPAPRRKPTFLLKMGEIKG